MPKIAGMKVEEAKTAVDQMVSRMERMIDQMAGRGNAEQADALEAKLDKIQDLVDDGKLADAQKIIDTIDVASMFGGRGGQRGRGRGRGGEQGGGRRRGGRDTEEGGEKKEGEKKKEGEGTSGGRRRRR